jgi:VIT1/CCC1 family predicted Fe2+/Mn2+ transporter
MARDCSARARDELILSDALAPALQAAVASATMFAAGAALPAVAALFAPA